MRGYAGGAHGLCVCGVQLGRRLAHRERVSYDKTVRVWDVATKECVATLEGHTGYVNAVCGLGDGSRIASGSGRQDGARVGCGDKGVRGHAGGAHGRCDAVCSLGDGSRIASGSFDKTVRVWDVATKECVATLGRGAHDGAL